VIMRRGYIFWGLILILLGGLMFMNSVGIRLPGNISAISLFFPGVLVLLGIWIMFGVSLRHDEEDEEQISIDLQGTNQASLKLSHGAGRVLLGSGASSGQLLNGTFKGGVKQTVRKNGDRLDAHLEAQPFRTFFPFFVGWQGMEWNININRDIPLALRLETGASEAQFDLHDLKVTDLKISTGASKTEVTLPSNAGESTVKVEMGAASLDMVVPQGVAARIRAEHGMVALDVDKTRFPYSNGIYQSEGYSSAQNRADILIQAGAGKVTIL